MTTLTFGEWLLSRSKRTRQRPLSAHTVRHKVSSMNTVRGIACEYLGQRKQGTKSQVADQELTTWLTERENVETMWDVLAMRTNAGTMRNTYYALRDFESYAKAQRWATALALDSTDLVPRDDGKPVQVFSADEVRTIEVGSRMKGLRWHLFAVTLAETGMRIGNALSLSYANVVTNHDVPHFALETSKTGRPLVVPMSDKLQELWTPDTMHTLRSAEPAGNRTPARDLATYPFPWSYSNALARWTDMLTMLGIEYRSPHKLRATLATDLLVKGAPLIGVAALLGHSSIQTTHKYYAAVSALTYADLLKVRTQ